MNRLTAERAVLETLAESGTLMHRLDIGAVVFKKTGGTLLASVIGSLLTRGLIERPQPDPGPKVHRYRITQAGLYALALEEAREGAA